MANNVACVTQQIIPSSENVFKLKFNAWHSVLLLHQRYFKSSNQLPFLLIQKHFRDKHRLVRYSVNATGSNERLIQCMSCNFDNF